MAAGEKSNTNGFRSKWSLHGNTALVTGGTRGIGHAIVEDLCGFGATVHTCSRNRTELNKCLDLWRSKGYLVSGSVCDVSSLDQREKLIQDVTSIFNGKLNIYVNNVGANFRKPTIEYTAEVYSEIMKINLGSAYHMCQLTHPLLKASGMGTIVFISSIAGVVSLGTGSVYAASKAAINQLTKNLACEWAEDGIRSNCVVPATTNTPLVEHLLRNKQYVDEMLSRTPLGRIAEAEEISSLVAFLCLPASSYITGQSAADDGMSRNIVFSKEAFIVRILEFRDTGLKVRELGREGKVLLFDEGVVLLGVDVCTWALAATVAVSADNLENSSWEIKRGISLG